MRTVRRIAGRSVAAKVMAALGAVCLVGAFAMATLMQPLLSLAQLVMMFNEPFITALDRTQRSGTGSWIWSHLAVPVLIRPAWMMPTMLGVVLVGVAAQLAWGSRR